SSGRSFNSWTSASSAPRSRSSRPSSSRRCAMQLDSIRIVAKREYLQRIKGRAFWLATLILPLFLVAVTVLPSLLLSRAEPGQKVVVVDSPGQGGEEVARDPAKPPKPPQPSPEAAVSGKGRADALKEASRARGASFEPVVEPARPDRAAQRED